MSKTSKTTKKVVAVGVAAVMSATSMLAGTLAWQSINQRAANVLSGVVNPGGRLHDDFDGKEEKNVYVENFGTQNIFARIQLSELLIRKDGVNADDLYYSDFDTTDGDIIAAVEDAEKVDLALAEYYVPYDYAAADSQADLYWKKVFGGDGVSYFPTLNMDQNSFAADLNGVADYEKKVVNKGDNWTTDEGNGYNDLLDSGATTGTEVHNAVEDGVMYYDADDGVASVTATDAMSYAATSKSTHVYEINDQNRNPATTMSAGNVVLLSQWEGETGNFWVYDDISEEAGWFYWAQAIAPGYKYEARTIETDETGEEDNPITTTVQVLVPNDEAENTTGPLLNALEDLGAIDEDYVYSLYVDAQFVTKNDLGETATEDNPDGTGFYANGNTISDAAMKLLEAIGAVTPAEEESEGGEEDDEGEGDGPTLSLMIGTEYLGDPHTYYISAEEFKNTGIAFSAEFSGNTLYSDEADWTIDNENVEGSIGDDNSTYYVKYTGEEISDLVTFYIECDSGYGTSASTVTVFTSADGLTTAFANGGTIGLGNAEFTTTASAESPDSAANIDADYFWTEGGTLNGGTLNLEAKTNSGFFINAEENWPVADDGAAGAVINGTVINANGTKAVHTQAIDADITLNNVTINADNCGLYANFGSGTTYLNNVIIEAGTSHTVEEWLNSAVFVCGNANVVIEGGSYSGEYAVNIAVNENYPNNSVVIYDGYFDGQLAVGDGALTIYGGTFTVDPTNYVAAGCEVIDNDDGTWTVS